MSKYDDLLARLDKIRVQSAAAIRDLQEGVRVPWEPTKEMKIAGLLEYGKGHSVHAIYTAMLAAAPPAQPDKIVPLEGGMQEKLDKAEAELAAANATIAHYEALAKECGWNEFSSKPPHLYIQDKLAAALPAQPVFN
jgi:hypothetical protein